MTAWIITRGANNTVMTGTVYSVKGERRSRRGGRTCMGES